MQKNSIEIPEADSAPTAVKVAKVVTMIRLLNPEKVYNERVRCIKCEKLLLSPMQTSCGCRYCRDCIVIQLRENANKCHDIECEEITSAVIERATTREIGAMIELCPYPECEAQDKIVNLADHMETCAKRPEKCNKCKKLVFNPQSEKHLKDECIMAEIECPNCKRPIIRNDLEDHLNPHMIQVCPELICVCPNKCSNEPFKISAHKLLCPNDIKNCPYNCHFRGTRLQLNEHMYDKAKQHIQEITDEWDQKMRSMEENLRNYIQNSIREILNPYKSEKNANLLQDKLGTQISTPEMDGEDPIGPCTWIIPEFTLKLALARSSDSEVSSFRCKPFYLFKRGYLLSLKIYPNGDGIGKGTHLSVYFMILKGKYDDILPWPFAENVMIRIMPGIDKWSDGRGETFKPNITERFYQKPTSHITPTGVGTPTLIEINTVLSKFMKDDTVYIQVRRRE